MPQDGPPFSFDTGKLGDLAGFASALVLAIFPIGIAGQSVSRLFDPISVAFGEAANMSTDTAPARAADHCPAVTRHSVSDPSSAMRSAPAASKARPTGRPRALPSLPMKPLTTVMAFPLGRPLANGTKTTR